jgi:hypothetical protein
MPRLGDALGSPGTGRDVAARGPRLGEILMDMGFLEPRQLELALEEQKRTGQRLGAILIDAGWISEARLVRALSRQLGVPTCDPVAAPVHERVRALLPRELAHRLHALPIALKRTAGGDVLCLVTSDPLNPTLAPEIAAAVGVDVELMIAGDTEIEVALAKHYGTAAPAFVQPNAPPSLPPIHLSLPPLTPSSPPVRIVQGTPALGEGAPIDLDELVPESDDRVALMDALAGVGAVALSAELDAESDRWPSLAPEADALDELPPPGWATPPPTRPVPPTAPQGAPAPRYTPAPPTATAQQLSDALAAAALGRAASSGLTAATLPPPAYKTLPPSAPLPGLDDRVVGSGPVPVARMLASSPPSRATATPPPRVATGSSPAPSGYGQAAGTPAPRALSSVPSPSLTPSPRVVTSRPQTSSAPPPSAALASALQAPAPTPPPRSGSAVASARPRAPSSAPPWGAAPPPLPTPPPPAASPSPGGPPRATAPSSSSPGTPVSSSSPGTRRMDAGAQGARDPLDPRGLVTRQELPSQQLDPVDLRRTFSLPVLVSAGVDLPEATDAMADASSDIVPLTLPEAWQEVSFSGLVAPALPPAAEGSWGDFFPSLTGSLPVVTEETADKLSPRGAPPTRLREDLPSRAAPHPTAQASSGAAPLVAPPRPTGAQSARSVEELGIAPPSAFSRDEKSLSIDIDIVELDSPLPETPARGTRLLDERGQELQPEIEAAPEPAPAEPARAEPARAEAAPVPPLVDDDEVAIEELPFDEAPTRRPAAVGGIDAARVLILRAATGEALSPGESGWLLRCLSAVLLDGLDEARLAAIVSRLGPPPA